MANSAGSEVSVAAEMKKSVSHDPDAWEVANGDGGELEMRRRLFERFMATCDPGRPYLYEAPKVHTHPCVLYTMKLSVKNARASWSLRSSRRFSADRRGSFPIPLCRAAGPDGQVEPVVDRSGVPVKPDLPGIVSAVFENSYDLLELSREKGVVHKEGSTAPWREVAVIRRMPGGRGISLTSHVRPLVVRLHDILFLLPGPSATVDLRFSEQWFHLPTWWKEENLYAEDGFHIVDIASSVENLVSKWMRKQDDKEIERQRFETEEEKEMRLQKEETTCQLEVERRKIYKQKEVLKREEAATKPPVRTPLVWDDAHPPALSCCSKFKLSMDRTKKVYCRCVEQDGLQLMLQRVNNGEYVLPISKIASGPATSILETLGFVEGYTDLGTLGLGPKRGHFMDQSGRTLSSVLMVSRSTMKVLTINILVHKLDILFDDGMVMSGHSGVSVDIHCDDISSQEHLKTNWVYHILCKNIDGEGRTPFSALLVHLKKKLKLHLTKEELRLSSLTGVEAGEDNEDLAEQQRKQEKWVLAKPKPDLAEVELNDCMLFSAPSESSV